MRWGRKIQTWFPNNAVGMMRACVSILAVLAFPAWGALPEIARIDWGYDGALRAESWNPVRVWLRGDRAFSGVLTAEYTQDGSQSARVSVQAACTPGVDSPVELLIAPASHSTTITLTLAGDGDSVKRDLDAATPGMGFTMRAGPEGALTVLGLGQTSVVAHEGESAVRTRDFSAPVVPATALVKDKPDRWSYVSVVRAEAGRMPLAWTAYDCAGVVVVPGDLGMDPREGVDPRALSALREWVMQGGSLVVQVEGAGTGWTRFVDDGLGMPATVRESDAVQLRERIHGLASVVKEHEQVEIATSIQGRLIELTEAGRNSGWTLDWSESGPNGDRSTGLMARGPVGFGSVTLLGVDPSRVPATAKKDWQMSAWRHVLHEPLFAEFSSNENEFRNSWNWGWVSSGKDEATRKGIAGYLNAITNVPVVGDGAFLGIAGCVVILALLVGPIDAVGLRRLGLRQRSWATALAWIVLASLGAYAAPRLVRTGEHAFNRGVVEDVIQMGEAPGGSALLAQSGVTGVFGASPCAVRVSGSPSGAWWRGVSPLQSWNTRRTWLAALPLVQRTGESGGARECVPGVLGLSQWTYRTLADMSPVREVQGGIGARVTREGAGWVVEISGVPRGASLVKDGGTRLIVGETAYRLTSEQPGTGVWTMLASQALAREQEEKQVVRRDGPQEAVHYGVFPLAGARERSGSIAARIASGRWALVVLDLKGVGCDLALETPSPEMTMNARRMVRLLVPLHPADAAPASNAPTHTPTSAPKGASTGAPAGGPTEESR